MWSEAVAFLCSLLTVLYQTIVPCPSLELLPANTLTRQQYLGKWFFKAAVSHRDADIQSFRALDNVWFTMEEKGNDTLLLTGHTRIGDNCINQTWTYIIRQDELDLTGKKERKTIIWSGKWINCPDCIMIMEVEPPLHESDSEDSLNRLMLYSKQVYFDTWETGAARKWDVDPKVVKRFLDNAACNNMQKSVNLPFKKA